MVPGFEWDIEKADSNFKKHGVRFSQAVTALEDAYALTIEDFILANSVSSPWVEWKI